MTQQIAAQAALVKKEGGRRLLLSVALAVFFTSGFAALLYQVIWQRLLGIFSGADVYSATVIVAAFMGGLGVGHLVGGHVADRVSRRTSLVMFCGAEAAIAAFGFFSAALYYGFLYTRLGHLDIGREAMAGILFGSLLWPTFFMGASLPLLARAVTDRLEHAASTIGALYGLNTLGAALGATVGTWFFLPHFGLEGSLRIGAILNVLCAAALLPVAVWLGRSPADPPVGDRAAIADSHAVVHPEGLPVWLWMLLYGFAGFVALSLEIVWFRLLGVMMKSTAFTFGTLLAVYLAGIGLGAVAGSALAPRVRRPGTAFLGLQAAGGIAAALLLMLVTGLSDDIGALRAYFGSYEPLSVRDSVDVLRRLTASVLAGGPPPAESPATFLGLYAGLPLLLIFPPTFLIGCAFPFLQRVVQTELARVGRRVGGLLLANIVGSILGTVATGWISLSVLGTAGTLRLLVVLSSLFALIGIATAFRAPGDARPRFRRFSAVIATATAVAVLLVVRGMPDNGRLWARLHGTTVARIIFAEDSSGVSVITMPQGSGAGAGERVVFVNGVGQSVIPYGGIHTVLGALPAFVHPDPRDAAIIGLGSGDTVYAVAGRPGLERITSIEIVGPQLETLQALARSDPYGGLQGLLGDPRIEHVVGDGRIYLMRSSRSFDIIEADALRPTSAYSGNLYSDAYFRLVRDRLKRNGIAATWTASERVHDAFVKVFPYVISVPGVMLGSREPLLLNREAVAARLADPRVRAHYWRAGIDIEKLLASYLTGEQAHYGPDFDRRTLTDFNTDLFPKDEYDLSPPRR